MDGKSHEIFSQIILESIGIDNISPSWSTSPDSDINFCHRWYRHRISKIPKLYLETPYNIYNDKQDDFNNKESIVLSIVSHLYLDIFNGIVFPFGFWNPILPEDVLMETIIEDINKPRRLVEDINKLSGKTSYSDKFYNESIVLMKNLVIENMTIEELTTQFITRLAYHTNSSNKYKLLENSLHQIIRFTENGKYKPFINSFDDMKDDFQTFEHEYAKLIDETLED